MMPQPVTPARIAAYQTALTRLPPATRTLFRLHRERGLSYHDIAVRVDVDAKAVEGAIAEALCMLVVMLRDDEPRRIDNQHLSAAESILDRRHANGIGRYLATLLTEA